MIPQEELNEYRDQFAARKRKNAVTRAWYNRPSNAKMRAEKREYGRARMADPVKRAKKNASKSRWRNDPSFPMRRTSERAGWHEYSGRLDPALRCMRGMLNGARQRAKGAGLAFNLTLDDVRIPLLCPVFHVPFNLAGTQKDHAGSPSLDRLHPERGYIRGNVVVVTHRANMMKSNATASELRQLANFYAPLLERE